jgi:hypothetical protein
MFLQPTRRRRLPDSANQVFPYELGQAVVKARGDHHVVQRGVAGARGAYAEHQDRTRHGRRMSGAAVDRQRRAAGNIHRRRIFAYGPFVVARPQRAVREHLGFPRSPVIPMRAHIRRDVDADDIEGKHVMQWSRSLSGCEGNRGATAGLSRPGMAYRIRSRRFRIAAQEPSRILRSPRDGHQLDEPADRLRVQLDVPRCGPRPTAPSGRRIACQNAVIMSSRSCLTQSRGNAAFCPRSRSGTGPRHPRRLSRLASICNSLCGQLVRLLHQAPVCFHPLDYGCVSGVFEPRRRQAQRQRNCGSRLGAWQPEQRRDCSPQIERATLDSIAPWRLHPCVHAVETYAAGSAFANRITDTDERDAGIRFLKAIEPLANDELEEIATAHDGVPVDRDMRRAPM